MEAVQIEIFTLCHSATCHKGTLSMLDTFDTFRAPSFPTVCSAFTIVLRARFFEADSGQHDLRIGVTDSDSKSVYQVEQLFLSATADSLRTHLHTHIARVETLRLEKPGDYWLEARIGKHEAFGVPIWAELESAGQQ
jgi:hypothetical protein